MLGYLIIIYAVVGLSFAAYIIGSHFRACFEYIRQLYTAKHVRPKDIKTYFGVQYWEWNNSDDWGEVIVMTTLPAIMFALISVPLWPFGIFFVLHNSIKKARKRIENDE